MPTESKYAKHTEVVESHRYVCPACGQHARDFTCGHPKAYVCIKTGITVTVEQIEEAVAAERKLAA